MAEIPEELQPQTIMKLFETFFEADGVLRQFFPAVPNPIEGPNISYDVVDHTRRMAHNVPRFAPAPKSIHAPLAKVNYEAVSIKEAVPLPPQYKDMRAWGSLTDARTRQATVARAVREMRASLDLRREWLRAQFLTGGALLSSTGLPYAGDSPGTVYIDYYANGPAHPIAVNLGMDTNLLNTTVAASWTVATTDILGDLEHGRELVQRYSGVDANVVILNRNTMQYIRQNTWVRDTDELKTQIAKFGEIRNMWGFEFIIYDRMWPQNLESMENAGADLGYLIPDNMVIVTSRDNVACGRAELDCSPSDSNAPQGMRGLYAWTDQTTEHPHALEPGVEWTGGPMLALPKSQKIFTDVTCT